MVESFTPKFIECLQNDQWNCQCAGCEGKPPLVTLGWGNQQRRSAYLACDSAAHAILLPQDAFVLTKSEHTVTETSLLPEHVLRVNQHCINLLVGNSQPLAVGLYTIGLLISKYTSQEELAAIDLYAEQLAVLLDNGSLTENFDMLPAIIRFKHEALQQLAQLDIRGNFTPQIATTIAIKMNEIRVLSTDYLQQMIDEWQSDERVCEALEARYTQWVNLALYHCYHYIFPGEEQKNWPREFYGLVLNLFHAWQLLALLISSGITPDDHQLSSLIAALNRAGPVNVTLDEPLLGALALLR